MVHEVVAYLVTIADGVYLDGTVGSGGHSEIIGQEIIPKGQLICLDRDSEAVKLSRERLLFMGEKATVIKANYVDSDEILNGLGFEEINGILLDLGVSSQQIEGSGRGFSFNRDEPLDMRMDMDDEITAHKLVNTLLGDAKSDIYANIAVYAEYRAIWLAILIDSLNYFPVYPRLFKKRHTIKFTPPPIDQPPCGSNPYISLWGFVPHNKVQVLPLKNLRILLVAHYLD